MSQNIQQIFVANPASSMVSTDLLYLGRSPYTSADDFAITFANFVASIGTATPTASTIPRWDANINFSANNFLSAGTVIVSAAGLTTLTVASTYYQLVNGSTTQTIKMPVVSTLPIYTSYRIDNTSSGNVTVESSGPNTIQIMVPGSSLYLTSIAITGTSAAVWQALYLIDSEVSAGITTIDGDTGSLTPSAGIVTISGGTSGLTFAGASHTLTLAGTLGTGNGGTGVTGASTGSGGVVLNSSPTITTPVIVQINDALLNIVLKFVSNTSAVNWAEITNGSTGNGPTLKASGGDANVSLNLSFTGTGGLNVNSEAANIPLIIYNGTNSQHETQFSFSNTSATRTVTFPDASGTVAFTGGIGSFTWNDVSGTTQTAAVNNGYIISNSSATTVTVPATCDEGSVFSVAGKGAAGWILQMNTGQIVHYGSSASSSAGTISSTNQWDSVTIVCVTANTTFIVTASQGVLTVA